MIINFYSRSATLIVALISGFAKAQSMYILNKNFIDLEYNLLLKLEVDSKLLHKYKALMLCKIEQNKQV